MQPSARAAMQTRRSRSQRFKTEKVAAKAPLRSASLMRNAWIYPAALNRISRGGEGRGGEGGRVLVGFLVFGVWEFGFKLYCLARTAPLGAQQHTQPCRQRRSRHPTES